MSLNDPQWGKRGRNGPPDLDEIWRNLTRRINDLFGRREPVDPVDEPPPRRQLPLGGAGLIVVLVLVVWLASGFYIVDEGRRGVVTRFGKYTETTTPGLRWHLPFPIEARRGDRFLAGQDRRDRLPQRQSEEQDRQGIADADR